MKKLLLACLVGVSTSLVAQKKNYLNTEVGLSIPISNYSLKGYADLGYNYGVEYIHFFNKIGLGVKLNSISNGINNYTFLNDFKDGLGGFQYDALKATHDRWNNYNLDFVTAAKVNLSDKFDLLFKTILGVQLSSFPTHTISVSTSDNYITQKITGDMSSSFHYGGEFQLAYNVSEKYAFNLSIGTSFSTQNFSGTIRTEDIYAIDYSSFTSKQEISMFNIYLGYTYKF